MKRLNRYATLCVATLAGCVLTACSSENETDTDALGALRVQATIAGTTRVANNAFEKGDAIGLHAVSTATDGLTAGSNVLYTATDADGNFTSTTPIYYKDVNAVNFMAYYPYQETLTDGTLTVKTADQVDYLFAKAQKVAVNTETVALTFDHVLTRVTLLLKAGDGVTDLQNLTTVTLKAQAKTGTFDTTTGAVTTGSETADYSLTFQPAAGDTEASGSVLLVPNTQQTSIALEVAYDGATYQATLTAASGLAAGTSYAYTVTVTRTGVKVTGTAINDWSEGEFTNASDASASATIQPES